MSRYLGLIAFLLVSVPAWSADTRSMPNLLIFYVDDMGWAQPRCYGGELAATPHIDALAASGIRFTDGYVSACICSPSRVGLMTGRYQARSGHDSNANRPGRELVLSETTMAQRLKEAGYTTAIVGKWHLGSSQPEFLPGARGFDHAFGSVSNLGDGGRMSFYRGKEIVETPPGAPITTPIYTRETVEFIDKHQEKPWFLYMSFNAVHAPHVASEKWLEKFHELPRSDQNYAGIIAEADEAIGAVMARLRELQLEEKTLVFLISDNGGAASQAEMGGLRGRKWFVWEGGIRVSWIASWKGQIPPGQVCHEPVIQLDVLPTALAAANAETKSEWQLDGVNLLPLLLGKVEKLPARDLFWRYGIQYAIRSGNWKLVKASLSMEPMLVDLDKDRGEQTDLSAEFPEKKAELQRRFDAWNAQMQPPRWEDQRWNGDDSRLKKQRKAKAKAQ